PPPPLPAFPTRRSSDLQIRRLEEAGCEVIRVTVPKKEDVEGVEAIRDQIKIPLIADIHYDYRMALACLEARTPTGRRAVDKIRRSEEHTSELQSRFDLV